MAHAPDYEDLFKFVTVRAPTAASLDLACTTFAVYSTTGHKTHFHQSVLDQLQETRSIEILKGMAAQYRDSQDFTTGLTISGRKKGVEADLRWVVEQHRCPSRTPLRDDIERLMGDTVERVVADQAFNTMKERLWSSLYAAYLLRDRYPAELDAVVSAVQVVQFLERAAKTPMLLDDAQAAFEALAAVPLLPRDIFEPMLATSPDLEVAPRSGVPAVTEATGVLIQLEQEIHDIDAALRELDLAETRRMEAFPTTREKAVKEVQPPRGPEVPRQHISIAVREVADDLPPWRLPSTDVAKFELRTRSLLEALGFAGEALEVPRARDAMERLRSAKVMERYRVVGS